MIVDTSAVIAILEGEPEGARFTQTLIEQPTAVSAATLAEAFIVALGYNGDGGADEVDTLIRSSATAVIAVDEHQARVVRDAYRRFGRGSGHPARLNYGDCFSYALAVSRDEPLLFKGDNFAHTDVRRTE